MQFNKITVSYHALLRFITQFEEWSHLTIDELTMVVQQLIEGGTPIGAQLGNDLAVEGILPTNERVYFVGSYISGEFIVRTTLTREKLIANMGQMGIKSPDKQPKRHKFSRRNRRSTNQRLKQSQPWRMDPHFEPDAPRKRVRPKPPPPIETDL